MRVEYLQLVEPMVVGFCSTGVLNANKLMLVEDNNLISEEYILANTMNQYFTSITKQLNLK